MSLLLIHVLNAQNLHNDVRYYDDEKVASIQFNSFGYYGSSVLDIHTSKLFYQGGFFNDNLKNESLNRLTDLNYFGGEYGVSMTYNNPISTMFDDAGFYASYELGGSAGMSFSEDLFRVIFQGNTGFIGDTARLGPMEISNYQFKKIGFGLNQDDRIKFGIGLLSFDAWQKARVSSGNLAVDNDLDSVTLGLEGRFRNSATVNAPAGFGVGMDLEVTFPLDVKNDTIGSAKLIAGIKNVGLFISNKNMVTYDVDGNYSFSGFNISSISDFQSSVLSASELQDSLVPKGVTDRIVDLMPFELYFYSTSRPDGKKLQLVYGFRYRYATGSMPQAYIGGDWRPNEKTIFSNYLHVGGYALFQWGMSLKKSMGKVKIGLTTNNLHGFFTNEAYSQSLGLTMSYVIK